MEYYAYFIGILLFALILAVNHSVISAYSLVICPYIVILFLNNTIGVKLGFIRIDDNTCSMLIYGTLSFATGTIFAEYIFNRIDKVRDNKSVKREYGPLCSIRIKPALYFTYIVIILRILQLALKFSKYGFEGMVSNDYEQFIARGPVGHLLISVFPLMPVFFFYWLKNKRKIEYLIPYIVYLILAFVETEKAQSISLVIATFLFCIFVDTSYLWKGIVALFILVAILFAGNYMVKFTIAGAVSGIPVKYYLSRIWTYIAGGLINTNLVTNTEGIRVNALDYLVQVFFAFFNMISNRLLDFRIGLNVGDYLPYIKDFPYVTVMRTGFTAQTSNVVSTMTMMYGNGDLIAFLPVCTFWGIFCESFIQKMKYNKTEFSVMLGCCAITFGVISFFASYYTIASFTERLIYCLIWGIIFNKKYRICFGKKNFDIAFSGE